MHPLRGSRTVAFAGLLINRLFHRVMVFVEYARRPGAIDAAIGDANVWKPLNVQADLGTVAEAEM